MLDLYLLIYRFQKEDRKLTQCTILETQINSLRLQQIPFWTLTKAPAKEHKINTWKMTGHNESRRVGQWVTKTELKKENKNNAWGENLQRKTRQQTQVKG